MHCTVCHCARMRVLCAARITCAYRRRFGRALAQTLGRRAVIAPGAVLRGWRGLGGWQAALACRFHCFGKAVLGLVQKANVPRKVLNLFRMPRRNENEAGLFSPLLRSANK